jgi:hypothetical protein
MPSHRRTIESGYGVNGSKLFGTIVFATFAGIYFWFPSAVAGRPAS